MAGLLLASEELYAQRLSILNDVFKDHFTQALAQPAPMLTQVDVAFIFYNMDGVQQKNQQLINAIKDLKPDDSICDVLTTFFSDVSFLILYY